MADSSLDLSINIGANTQDFANQLQKAENLLGQFQAALKKSTNVGEINYLNTQINNLNTTIDTLKVKMSGISKPSGDATNALTNLSRVAQDAPYGFMGIANNLNPLLESFQRLSKESGGAGNALKALVGGLTGPAGIGLALGAISSLVVAFGDDISKFIEDLVSAGGATQEMKSAISGIGTEFTNAVEKVNKVEIAFSEYHKGLLTGEEALKIYNRELGASLGVKSNINEAEKIFKDKTPAYIEAQLQRSLADAASKKAAEELLKQKQMSLTGPQNNWIDFVVAIGQGGTTQGLKNVAQKRLEDDKAASENIIAQYKKIATDAQTAADEIAKANKIVLDPQKAYKPKKEKSEKQDVDTSDLETLKKKQQLYKDDVYAYKEYADLITQEEEKIALKKAKINKASANEIQNIKEQAAIGLQQNAINLGNSLDKIFKAADDKLIKDQKESEKVKLSNQLEASKDSLDIVKKTLDVETKLAGDSYEERKEALKKAMAETKILMALSSNPKAVQELDKAYKDMDKQYKLLDIDQKQKDTKKLQDNYKKFADTIANDVTQGFMVMFDAMSKGENPLQALGNYLGDLVKQFAAAIIQATIFKGIMSLLNLATGGGTGFLGGILGGVGKLLGMAEGGVVSQPTLAMVGEGGQSEAVMPLNKLSNMLGSTFNAGAMSGAGAGSGNGQFVLKGNDLVLALQRSNYSLNLRRGNGI